MPSAFVTGGGRGIGAGNDDVDELLAGSDEIRERDLNAIRLQR